jgi:Ubiquitin carboxyl-terminal hydrolase
VINVCSQNLDRYRFPILMIACVLCCAVVWKNAVESLKSANMYLATAEAARRFVEGYMQQVIGILVEQQPSKIGQHERSCVEESLELATMIIAKDIKIQQKRKGESSLLVVLALIFNRKKAYYKGTKGNWNVNHFSGLPEVRLRMIDRFRAEGGFANLADYLSLRINTSLFPSLEFLLQILNALSDAVPNRQAANDDKSSAKEMEDHAIMVSQAVMDYINSFTDETLKKQPPELINTCRYCLQRIFDRLVVSSRNHTYMFYAFWRSLILKLITSRSLPLRLTGWEQLKECIEASQEHRPPPKMFVVSQAGVPFVNGIFSFAGPVTSDGYAQRGDEICYKRRIQPSETDSAGKDLTLFRCTMRSQQKWWFLSEADEEQPGTDRDIDYYQHKSKEHEELEPPPRGWVTCRNAGVDPPPQLRGRGLMVPKGEEYNTLEHLLARWAIENNIVELVLGASLHREVVNRSTPLIEFLATMCERDELVKGMPDGGVGPNAFCLKAEHLLLAWRTCASKTDAAVSEEIYQLLVSILPSLPKSLAIPLFQAVEGTLNAAKGNSLFEVAEFCGALATSANMDAKVGQVVVHYFRSEDVRSDALKLLWAVLTHPNASALKNYDILKQYVTNELRIDPLGRVHRETFLDSCTRSLSLNAELKAGGAPVDEFLALRIVKLTLFVLEACPPEQAMFIVNANRGFLASLLFNELTAYLSRRKVEVKASPSQKRVSWNLFVFALLFLVFGAHNVLKMNSMQISVGSVDLKMDNSAALYERLRILRYVYGVSEKVKLSIVQLQHLWQLCDIPADRVEVMIFVAHASTFGNFSDPSVPEAGPLPRTQGLNDCSLSAAFSDEVRVSAFLDLFCSNEVNWDELGEGAYKSFHLMFKRLRQSPGTSLASSGPSLDALWRICLTAGNENVATQSMKDLLAVYAAMATVDKAQNSWSAGPPVSAGSEQMQMDDGDESFGNRVFRCLADVKKGLDARDPSSERSAERCLRILNAAVGQDGNSVRSITSSTVSLLSSLPSYCSLADAIKLIPHGMRGQSSYRRIGVMAKRTNANNAQSLQQIAERDTQGGTRQQSTIRFSLDVHPLETLSSVKAKVAHQCQCSVHSVKPISASGRLSGVGKGVSDSSQLSLNVVPDDSTVDQLGIAHGCEMVFVIADRQGQGVSSPASNKGLSRKNTVLDLSEIFGDPSNEFAAKIFQTLLSVLEALPWRTGTVSGNPSYKLVWDLLLALPTNAGVESKVRLTAGICEDSKMVDSINVWASVIDAGNFQRSVYVLQATESFLQPAHEVLSILPLHKISEFDKAMKADSTAFRRGFIDSGGFTAVINFFSGVGATSSTDQTRSRMANAAALRILKCCLFGNNRPTSLPLEGSFDLDEVGVKLLESLSSAEGLLHNLTAMVVFDEGISTSTISDVLKFLRLLFISARTSETFFALPNRMAEKFVITLLLWEGGPESARSSSAMTTSSTIRKNMHDLVLSIPSFAKHALPWLINALDSIDVGSEATSEYFDALNKLVSDDEVSLPATKRASGNELKALGTAVSRKISSCPRPTSGSATIDVPTGVLCGCLKLLRALIEYGGGDALNSGTSLLLTDLGIPRWSEMAQSSINDSVLIDLMGALFDGFLSPGGSSSVVAICCDKESRQLGFDAVAAAARSCNGNHGYVAIVRRINGIVSHAAPYLRHRWGQLGSAGEGQTRSSLRNPSKYSGLRNQGCTCYMNSFLQQLFMMPSLRKAMCAAPLPTALRTSGGMALNGADIVGKKISLQWDTGVSYDAIVERFDDVCGMHTIRYCPVLIASVVGSANQIKSTDISRLPAELAEEFFLAEGRPGKETGVYEVITKSVGGNNGEDQDNKGNDDSIKETEDEVAARHLFEEVQRTFIHLDEGSRGRCFDPRALVEACACLKLEFDVWQQNDASEFAMKLLDRMEIVLKKWAPTHFKYLDHTFGLKQTKQKICKKCSLMVCYSMVTMSSW